MPNPILLGVPAMIALSLVSYFFRERCLRRLDVTQAGTVLLAARPIRMRFTAIFLGSVVIWVALMYMLPRQKTMLLFICLPYLLASIGIAQWIAWRALRSCQLPPDFLRNYRVSTLLSFFAYAVLFGALAMTPFFHARG